MCSAVLDLPVELDGHLDAIDDEVRVGKEARRHDLVLRSDGQTHQMERVTEPRLPGRLPPAVGELQERGKLCSPGMEVDRRERGRKILTSDEVLMQRRICGNQCGQRACGDSDLDDGQRWDHRLGEGCPFGDGGDGLCRDVATQSQSFPGTRRPRCDPVQPCRLPVGSKGWQTQEGQGAVVRSNGSTFVRAEHRSGEQLVSRLGALGC